MLQVIAFEILSPDIFGRSTSFGAGVVCVLIINLIWIIAKTYRARKKDIIDQTQTAQDHLNNYYHRFIDELQDTINQLMQANNSLRQELITSVQKLIKENAEYRTKLDYLTNSTQFVVSTVKEIKKNGNGNGHKEGSQPELPDK